MKITFSCESCRSELTVASHFAGRTILCPRCRRKTRIPSVDAASQAAPSPDGSQSQVGSTGRESSNVFAKLCADFAPNPFAFSVRLETFAPENGGEENATSSETPASKTPSVNELIATLLEE